MPGVESDILKSEASLLYEKTEQYRYAILSESIQRNELPEIRITDFPGGEDNAGGEHFQRVSSLIKEQFMTWQNRKNQKQLTLNKKIVERDAALARVSLYEHQVSQEGRKLNDFKYLLNKKLFLNIQLWSRKIAIFRQKMNMQSGLHRFLNLKKK